MQHIEKYPLASPLVEWSIATERVNARVSKITVDLLSRVILTPTAKAYFEANHLLPEVLSKAGLPEETSYSVLQQLSYAPAGAYYQYRLQLTIPTT
jgi:hypothetical protein